MNRKRRAWLVGGLMLVGTVLSFPVHGQQPELQRSLTRGKLWTTFRNTGTQGLRDDSRLGGDAGLMYPGFGLSERDFSELWGAGAGADRRYHTSMGEGFWILTQEDQADGTVFYNVSSSNPRNNSDDIVEMNYDAASGPERDLGIGTLSPVNGNTTANYWPGAPALFASDPVEIHNYDYGRYIPVDNEAEEIIVSKWTTERGLTVTRKARAWSYPDYDDFFIVEIVVENTGDANGDGTPDAGMPVALNDVYFAFVNNLAPSMSGHLWQQGTLPYQYAEPISLDDWNKYSEAPNFDGLAALRGKKISYAFDGDSPASPNNDTGQPYSTDLANKGVRTRGVLKEGELTAFQYVGVAPLDTTPPFTNDTEIYVAPRATEQPAFANWWEIFGRFDFATPDNSVMSDEQIYKELTGQGNVSALQDNPERVMRVTSAQTYGPYDLAPGDKAKIVLAWVAGSGAEFAGPQGKPMDDLEWALRGIQDQVTDGERALARHLDRAQFAYDNGYDLPDPPPDVAIFVDSDENGNNAITWSVEVEQALDPDYVGDEAKDVRGYRIYRSESGRLGPSTLVADIPVGGPFPQGAEFDASQPWTSPFLSSTVPGTYTFRDVESAVGFSYWYSVRTYDSGHNDWNGTGTAIPVLESGHSAPEQRMNSSRSPIVIATSQKDRLEDPVRVVPNPFRLDEVHRYPPGSDRIRFVNIPRQAEISIFSMSGDLIALIKHPQRSTDEARGEAAWDQKTRTFSGQAASGRYIYVVESLVAGQEGKRQTGMFAIIK